MPPDAPCYKQTVESISAPEWHTIARMGKYGAIGPVQRVENSDGFSQTGQHGATLGWRYEFDEYGLILGNMCGALMQMSQYG